MTGFFTAPDLRQSGTQGKPALIIGSISWLFIGRI